MLNWLQNLVGRNIKCAGDSGELIGRRSETALLDQRNDGLTDTNELRNLGLRPSSFAPFEFDCKHDAKTLPIAKVGDAEMHWFSRSCRG